MPSCLPQSKHVKLTQACFPKSKTATAKPNSSELQYLAYYASSRPKKLIKVGAFLRTKVIKDAYWNRQGDIIVNLEVCSALIEKCHNNLNLFATDVLHILQTALTVKDITILEHVRACWSVFCRYHDGVALGTDVAYTRIFLDVLNTLSEIAQGKQIVNEGLNARYTGMEAMKSATTSPALHATQAEVQIRAIVMAILDNLKTTKPETLYNMKQQSDRSKVDESRGRRSSFLSNAIARPTGIIDNSGQVPQNTESGHESTIINLSLDCLRQLFDCNDASQLVETTSQLLKHTSITEASNYTWTSSILHIAAEWTPINLRFHLLGACLKSLPKTSSDQWPTTSQENFLHIIHDLLSSRIILIGLSTIDVLDHLLTVAADALQKVGDVETETLKVFLFENDKDVKGSARLKFLLHIERAIVAINAHLYYNDQVRDIVRVIVEKVRLTASLETQGSNQLCTLFYLDTCTQLIRSTMARREEADPRSSLPMSTFDPIMTTLHNPAESVRLKFMKLLSEYYQLRGNGPIPHEDTQSRQRSLEHLRLAIYHYILLFSNRTSDMHHLTTHLQYLWHSLTDVEAESFLPVLYHAVQNSTSPQAQQCRAVDIVDLLCQILKRCMPSSNLDLTRRTISANNTLPSLSILLGKREETATISQMDTADRYVPAWLPDENFPYPSRAVSIRQADRSHMNASAVTSREQLVIPTNSVSLDNKSLTRITFLKQHLLSPRPETSTSNIAPPTLDLTSMFDGIELQTLHVPSVGTHEKEVRESAESSSIPDDHHQASVITTDIRPMDSGQLLGRVIS